MGIAEVGPATVARATRVAVPGDCRAVVQRRWRFKQDVGGVELAGGARCQVSHRRRALAGGGSKEHGATMLASVLDPLVHRLLGLRGATAVDALQVAQLEELIGESVSLQRTASGTVSGLDVHAHVHEQASSTANPRTTHLAARLRHDESGEPRAVDFEAVLHDPARSRWRDAICDTEHLANVLQPRPHRRLLAAAVARGSGTSLGTVQPERPAQHNGPARLPVCLPIRTEWLQAHTHT